MPSQLMNKRMFYRPLAGDQIPDPPVLQYSNLAQISPAFLSLGVGVGEGGGFANKFYFREHVDVQVRVFLRSYI